MHLPNMLVYKESFTMENQCLGMVPLHKEDGHAIIFSKERRGIAWIAESYQNLVEGMVCCICINIILQFCSCIFILATCAAIST